MRNGVRPRFQVQQMGEIGAQEKFQSIAAFVAVQQTLNIMQNNSFRLLRPSHFRSEFNSKDFQRLTFKLNSYNIKT